MSTFSFVICTFENSGRDERLRQVVHELKRQTSHQCEIVLVYEGSNKDLLPIQPSDEIKIVMTSLSSTSERRNIGAAHASNDIISFLDDDTFPVDDDYCARVAEILASGEIDFVICNIKSSGNLLAGRPTSADVEILASTIVGNMWEPGLAMRRTDFEKVKFDPTLGPGCIHGSSEGLDFGLRLLASGLRGRRIKDIFIDHPPLDTNYQVRMERLFFYSLGNGSVLIQHRMYATFVIQFAKALARAFVSVIKGDRALAAASLVRICCLIAGPFLPRRPARILPSSELSRTRVTVLPSQVHQSDGVWRC